MSPVADWVELLEVFRVVTRSRTGYWLAKPLPAPKRRLPYVPRCPITSHHGQCAAAREHFLADVAERVAAARAVAA